MKNEYIFALKRCPIFEGIRPEEYDKILKILPNRIRKYQKDECIIHFYDEISSFGIVIEGSVKGLFLNDRYDEIDITSFKTGMIFAEAIACNKMPSPIEVVALEKTIVLFIDVNELFDNKDSLIMKMHSNLTRSLSNKNSFLNYKVRLLSQKTTREKIIMYISSLPQNDNNYHVLDLNQIKLASYLGVNRSALSREISNMIKDKILIRNNGKIIKKYNNNF